MVPLLISKVILGVDPRTGVLKGAVIRNNLFLSASYDDDKDRALVSLLKGMVLLWFIYHKKY